MRMTQKRAAKLFPYKSNLESQVWLVCVICGSLGRYGDHTGVANKK